MNCEEAKAQIEQGFIGRTPVAQALAAHLQNCAQCRALAADWQLDTALQQVSAPALRAGFADDVMNQAWEQAQQPAFARRRAYSWVAAAATVAFAWFNWYSPTATDSTDPILAEQAPVTETSTVVSKADTAVEPRIQSDALVLATIRQVKSIHLQFESRQILPDATITVELDDSLQLAGYANTQRLSWQTEIKAGKNALTLPVELNSAEGGYLRLNVRSGTSAKHMVIAVKALADGSTKRS